MDRITSITDAKGMTTCNWYNETGMLAAASQPAAGPCPDSAPDGSFLYSYDPMDRLTTSTDPAGKSESFTYNDKGLLDTHTDRNGAAIKYRYDSIGRLSSFFGANGDVSFTYFPNTDLVASVKTNSSLRDITGGLTKIDNDYDELGRPIGVNTEFAIKGLPILKTSAFLDYNTNGQLIYGWDKSYDYYSDSGLLEKITTADGGEITYGYDGMFRDDRREISGVQKVTREYNAQGRMSHMASEERGQAGNIAKYH